MAQSPVTGPVQQHRQDTDETIPLKRPKKEPGAPTGKNVVVLKNNDVKEKDGIVFMPNTIDMAKLKKPQRGQFKKNVQISSKMTERDIKQILEEAFPFLKNKRFYCAGAAANRTRLDFHGERRIWDGRLIKQEIKGNSALYIYTDEGGVGNSDSTGSNNLTLKRSHDQMMTIKNKGRIETATHSVATDVMAQGSFVAPLRMAQNSISTASYSQTRETVPQTADRCAATENNIPPLYPLAPHSDLQGMVPSSLTSQMGSLNITNSSSGWEMDKYAQTAARQKLFTYAPFETMGKQGQGSGNGSIEGKSKQNSVVNTDESRPRDTTCSVNKAIKGRNKDVGKSGSDYESQLSDSAVDKSADSGIEASDGLCVNGDVFDTDSKHWQDLSSDVNPPSSSQMFNTAVSVSATEETSSCETADDIPALLTDLFGTVEGICPEFGSVEGGFKFYISFAEALSDEIQDGVAWFEGVAGVRVHRLNPFTMFGNVPRSQSPGEVPVTLITDTGENLGFTFFNYIDYKETMLEQLVKDRMLQAKYFLMLSTKFANEDLTSNSNIAQAQGQRILEENDFPVETKQQQSVKFLQLMVYTAAETDAQDFIEMVFSTSAGQIVFNSYKDRTPLPEDVARASRHKELAHYLQDVNTRLSKEAIGDVQCCAIDWLELVKAVQKRCYSAVETKQKQSVEMLQLLDYSAVKRDALWFIERVTSAGRDNLDYYKDRTPWPENVARTHGNEELAPFQDVHTRFSLNKNVHSTLTDWLELEEAEQKQSLATLESPIRLDLSDDDDDDSSGYFADAETSSCGSFDDDIEWSEISGNKEPRVHDEISNEVQNISEWGDFPMTFSSRASFTKNERIIGESTNGQITSEDISFAGKQSSCCLNKEEKGEFSELSKFMRTIRVPVLLTLSCNRLLAKGLELRPRPLEESFIRAYKVKLIVSDVVERPSVIYVRQPVRILFAKEKCFSAINLVNKRRRTMDLRLKRETFFFYRRLLMKEQHLLEREQLFGMQRLLAQKLSTKTEQLLSVRLLKRERKFQGTYEVSGDPLCKSVNSYEGEPKEVALAKLVELYFNTVAAKTYLENTLRVPYSRISKLQKAETNAFKELTLCILRHGAQTTYEEVQASLHVNDVQLEDLAVEFCGVLYAKPLESNLRKTDEITVGTLYDLSCDLRKEWKNLALALGVHDVTNDLVDVRNQTLRENCYNMLLLWKQRFGPQATYQALEVGLCHDSVQRKDLVEKYYHDFISSAKFAVPLWLLLLQMARMDMD